MSQAPAPLPLPDDPVLAAVAEAMEAAGQWAWVMDHRWNIVHTTTAVRTTYGGGGGRLADFAIGRHFFGPESLAAAQTWTFGPNSVDRLGLVLRELGCWVLTDTPGGADELRATVAPAIAGIVDEIVPRDLPALGFIARGMGIGMAVDVTARQHSERSLEQMETDLRAQSARLEGAYTYFSGLLSILQGVVRQGSTSDDVLALLGEAEVGVIAHRSGASGPSGGNNHRKCPNLNRCPAFRLLQLQAREVFTELYCEAEYERCARYASASRGERVSDNLMPHGVML